MPPTLFGIPLTQVSLAPVIRSTPAEATNSFSAVLKDKQDAPPQVNSSSPPPADKPATAKPKPTSKGKQGNAGTKTDAKATPDDQSGDGTTDTTTADETATTATVLTGPAKVAGDTKDGKPQATAAPAAGPATMDAATVQAAVQATPGTVPVVAKAAATPTKTVDAKATGSLTVLTMAQEAGKAVSSTTASLNAAAKVPVDASTASASDVSSSNSTKSHGDAVAHIDAISADGVETDGVHTAAGLAAQAKTATADQADTSLSSFADALSALSGDAPTTSTVKPSPGGASPLISDGGLAAGVPMPAAPAHAAATQAPVAPAPVAQFAEDNIPKVVTGVRTQLLPQGGTMQIRLDPPELGALQVTVEMRNGVMSASFQTSNDDATRLLSHSLTQLKTSLESQGVSVEKIQVQQGPREQQTGGEPSSDQQMRDEQNARQEQQRKETLQRMWAKLAGRDQVDVTA